MTVKAYPSEARTDVTEWLNKNASNLRARMPFTDETVSLVGDAVEAAAAENNWVRTFPDTDEYLDVKDLTDDLTAHWNITEFLPSFVAAIAAELGYRHGE